jgi:hypothetical protein
MKKKTEKIHKFDRPPLTLPTQPIRPGSMKILEAPSRIHHTLFYPNGTTKHENDTSNNGNDNT